MESFIFKGPTKFAIFSICIFWSIAIITIVFWIFYYQNNEKENTAKYYSEVSLENDLILRRWISNMGGVYLPVSENLKPNKYLTNIKDRDIETPTGKKLTLLNPAYMLRMVFAERENKKYPLVGNLTSLKPKNPINVPDDWERSGLEKFKKGFDISGISEIKYINGKKYMRTLKPLPVEESCLKCHADQGYSIGDIRGGISSSVAMGPLEDINKTYTPKLIALFGLIWALGVLGIIFAIRKLRFRDNQIYFLNNKLKENIEDLMLSNKRLESFTYMAAHDLKSPLATVSSFLEIIKNDFGDKLPGNSSDLVHHSSRIVGGMVNLITKLLNFTKLDGKVDYEKINVSDLLGEIVLALNSDINITNAKISYENLPEVLGDRIQLTSLFQNIIANALKYSKGNCPPEIAISFKELKKDEFQFCIKDNGIGIKSDELSKIFKLFYRTDSANKKVDGAGIGLGICQKIIDNHNGKIWVESKYGEGSKFYFILRNKEA